MSNIYDNIAIYDIETPRIGPYGPKAIDDIFCIAVKLVIDGKPQDTKIFTKHGELDSDGTLYDAMQLINSVPYRCGHNLSFDDAVCKSNGAIFTNKVLDTLVCTQIMYTTSELYSMDIGIKDMPKDLYMSYSLKAFGYRFNDENSKKIEFEDFSKLTPEMLVYCKQDVEVTYKLYKHIIASDRLPTRKLLDLESKVSDIIVEQESNGFYFDIPKARKLSLDLMLEQQAIERKLAKVFTPKLLPDGPIQKTNKTIKRKKYIPSTSYIDVWRPNDYLNLKPYRKPLKRFKSGKLKLPAKSKYRFFATPHRLIYEEKDGEFQNIKLTKFKATDNQIKIWLKSLYGFTFNTYTPKANIKVDRNNLTQLGEELEKITNDPTYTTYLSFDLSRFKAQSKETQLLEAECIQSLKRLIKLKKDLSQLSGGDKALLSKVRDNSTITSHINQNGTVTGRFTSSGGSFGVNLESFKVCLRSSYVDENKQMIYISDYNEKALKFTGPYRRNPILKTA